jgi:hypothetical protein
MKTPAASSVGISILRQQAAGYFREGEYIPILLGG